MFNNNGDNGLYMPVAPLGYGGGNGGGNGGFLGGDGLLALLLFAMIFGGWGGGFGGGGMGGFGNMMLGYDFPWLLNGQQGINNNVSDGFRDAQLNDNVTSVRDSIANLSTQLCGCCGDISTQLCNGFSGVNASISGAQNAIAQQLYTNQISDLERSFAAQTASTQGMTAIQSQLAQCCCDNRLATESLRATVLQENCQDRYEAANNTRDIIDNANRNNQSILDKLCQLELDGVRAQVDAKNDRIAELQTQLNMATLAASQARQTADIQNNIVNELRSCPIPSQPVYGSQPIFTCPNNNNNGCGCGCGNF